MPHFATIVITTKNRREDLAVALKSSLAQTVPAEVLVMDDGSTDGTSEMVRSTFPSVRLERSENSLGYVVQRNRAARMAKGDIIFSIDDDAVFSTPHVVEQTLAEFNFPCVGAVAIPYIEPHKTNRIQQSAPSSGKIWMAAMFIGTAHALRKDLFLELGGYREHLVHQGEESDYCIRLLAAGHIVRLGSAEPIHHFESPRRDFRRMDFYGCRNSILFAWQNVPIPHLPLHLAATTFNCLRWTFDPRRFPTRLRGIIEGYRDFLRTDRSPVSIEVYRRWRKLRTTRSTSMQSPPENIKTIVSV